MRAFYFPGSTMSLYHMARPATVISNSNSGSVSGSNNPSIASAEQVEKVQAFFQQKGIKVDGYVQWKQETAESEKDSDCVAHGICHDKRAGVS